MRQNDVKYKGYVIYYEKRKANYDDGNEKESQIFSSLNFFDKKRI